LSLFEERAGYVCEVTNIWRGEAGVYYV